MFGFWVIWNTESEKTFAPRASRLGFEIGTRLLLGRERPFNSRVANEGVDGVWVAGEWTEDMPVAACDGNILLALHEFRQIPCLRKPRKPDSSNP
jgi:hypothetical protein